MRYKLWDIANKSWYYRGDIYLDEDGQLFEIEEITRHYETYMKKENVTDKYVLVRWTGIKDCNGQDIHESDILATSNETRRIPDYDHWHKEDYGYTVVQWDPIYTCFEGSKWMWEMNSNSESVYSMRFVEVIGSIHENPELLEAKA